MSSSLTFPSNEVFNHFIATPVDTHLAEHQAANPENTVLALFHRCIAEAPPTASFWKHRA